MSIVTSVVASCLKAFAVDESKYLNIDKDCSIVPLKPTPSEEELAKVVAGKAIWSQRGLQNDFKAQEEVIDTLHALDFVCLSPTDGGQLFEVAQVTSINVIQNKTVIKLRGYKRDAKIERLLSATATVFLLKDLSRIKRVCWVGQLGTTDCDFTATSTIDVCKSCEHTRAEKAQSRKHLRRPKTMSLFGGAGGMDVGLAMSQFRTCWMIDDSAMSCCTFAAHHPATKVTQLLAGEALLNRTSLSTMPTLDEVEGIAMGPPCQPFSKINRQSREEREQDPRSLCVATGLSFVEVYRPTYGIIENVCGILENGNLGNVKSNGIVKFILRCLATLGYKTRIDIVQCNGFGIPQSRKRVIVVFALEGVSLPKIPRATHGTLVSNGLYPSVSIADATSDLPRWDIANPGTFGPSTAPAQERRKVVPPSLRLRSDGQIIAAEYCQYLSRPKTIFQQGMRSIASDQVADQFILAPFESPSLNAERFWHIPCRPHANHLSLQGLGQLEIPEILQTEDEAVFKNAFGRLDSKGAFPIIMTSIGLRGKSGRIIMPNQHRTPSIRELARAQGFPDGIRFQGSPAEKLTQIGNAVPIPLAFALGESIVDAMVTDFLRGDRRFAKQRVV